jgi:hypothetical protein
LEAKRWPKNASFARQETERKAEEGIRRLRGVLRDFDPAEAKVALAETMVDLSDIKMLMRECRYGTEPEAA